MGENDKAWAQTNTYVPPKIHLGGDSQAIGSSYRWGAVQPQSIINYLMTPSFTEDSKKSFDMSLFL